MDVLSCGGVNKAEASGVQCMSRQQFETVFDKLLVFGEGGAFEDPISAISFVVEQRVPDILHVDANLVGATGFETTFDQVDLTETFDHFVVCNGVFPL